MKKEFISILLIASFLPGKSFGQNTVIDSLRKELSGTVPDTVRAMSMMRLAVALETVDTAASIRMSDDAIRFTLPRKLYYYTGRIYFNKSFVLRKATRYDEAKNCLDSALVLLNKSDRPDVPFRKGQVYGELGTLSQSMDNYKQALDNFILSNELYLQANKPSSLITNYLNMATTYKIMNEFVKMEEYTLKALEQARQTQKNSDLFDCYSHMALALNMQHKYKPALSYIDSAKKYKAAALSYERIVSFELISGTIYINLNMLDSAYQAFERSRDLAVSVQDVFSTIQSELQVASVLMKQGKISEAEQIYLEQYEKIKQNPENGQLVVVLQLLSELYETKGEYKKSLAFFKELKMLNDSISQEANKKYAANLEITFNTRLKDAEISRQKDIIQQKNTQNKLLLLGFGLLVALILLLFVNYRQKKTLQEKRIQELEAKQKLLATEAILKGEEQERARLARDLHDGLGGMLSGIKFSLNNIKGNLTMSAENAVSLDKSIDMLNSSIQEMRRVAHNMMPEALVKFGLDTALHDFCQDLQLAAPTKVTYQSVGFTELNLPQSISIAVYRIIQELVNNALKYAEAGTILVQVAAHNKFLTITVEDDGIGFEPAAITSPGIGLKNIYNRVNLLNGTIDFQSKPGNGTSVLIEIPV